MPDTETKTQPVQYGSLLHTLFVLPTISLDVYVLRENRRQAYGDCSQAYGPHTDKKSG